GCCRRDVTEGMPRVLPELRAPPLSPASQGRRFSMFFIEWFLGDIEGSQLAEFLRRLHGRHSPYHGHVVEPLVRCHRWKLLHAANSHCSHKSAGLVLTVYSTLSKLST